METVGALLTRGERVLLGLRAPHKSFGGCWDLVGGHVEAGESPCEALCRELAEELGIADAVGQPCATIAYAAAGQSSLLHVYSVSTWRGDPMLANEEHSELRWFTFAEARQLSNLALPQYRSLFAALGRHSVD
jgi:mutator protein MutT